MDNASMALMMRPCAAHRHVKQAWGQSGVIPEMNFGRVWNIGCRFPSVEIMFFFVCSPDYPPRPCMCPKPSPRKDGPTQTKMDSKGSKNKMNSTARATCWQVLMPSMALILGDLILKRYFQGKPGPFCLGESPLPIRNTPLVCRYSFGERKCKSMASTGTKLHQIQ